MWRNKNNYKHTHTQEKAVQSKEGMKRSLMRCAGEAKNWAISAKLYEKSVGSIANVNEPLLVRLDGHRFAQLTRGFYKPYDWRIVHAMHHTSSDLLQHFNPDAVFTQSDEVRVCF